MPKTSLLKQRTKHSHASIQSQEQTHLRELTIKYAFSSKKKKRGNERSGELLPILQMLLSVAVHQQPQLDSVRVMCLQTDHH